MGGGPLGQAGQANQTPAEGLGSQQQPKRAYMTKRERQRELRKRLEKEAVKGGVVQLDTPSSKVSLVSSSMVGVSMSPLDITQQSAGLLQRESEEMLNLIMKTPQPTPSK